MSDDLVSPASIDVHPGREVGEIHPHVYGHFLESAFFGNIEDGVFDEGSPLSDDRPGARQGLRRDVIELCRELGVPILRWPGGNFTSPYHWEDGIGPRDARPRRLELAWGLEESNRFGTDEFLAWCSEVGAEPYLAHSARSVDEAVRWVEYTNYAGDTDYTRRRAENGHPAPYAVRHWGLGNEVYGPWQMGHRTARQYAADALEHARFMRHVDPGLSFVAVGVDRHEEEWTRPVLEALGGYVDHISQHLYGASAHLYADDLAEEWAAVTAQPAFFERRIQDYAQQVADAAHHAGIDRPLGIALDEWNIRHVEPASWPEPLASADGGFEDRDLGSAATTGGFRVNRWSPRTLADALFYAGVFHALHRASGLRVPVTMANTVNLVNANGLVVARPGGAIRSATYHVWDLYQNHAGPIAIAADVAGPARSGEVRQGDSRDRDGVFVTRTATIADLDVSATLTADRRGVRLVVINRSRTATVRARLSVDGRTSAVPRRATVQDLGADVDELFVGNSLGDPDVVALRDRGSVELTDATYAFPPHSITLLGLDLAP